MAMVTRILLVVGNIVTSQQFLFNSNNRPPITCITNILKEYYDRGSDLTVININSDDNEILEAIHQIEHVLIISRTTERIKTFHNSGYCIIVNNSSDFTENFVPVTKESSWNPYTKMIIVVRHLKHSDMRSIFNVLLKVHVVNVVLLNNTNTVDLYTYNPFEKYGCGRQYDRIITLGQCNTQQKRNNFFYNKTITDLRNCTFRITFSHFPPHVIDPTSSETSLLGLDQYVYKLIAEKEKFILDYRYEDNVEEFSIIVNDTIAVGPLRALQKNETDIVCGSMLLTSARSQVFAYIENIVSIDYLVAQVAAARQESLGNIFAEFQGLVWLSLIMVFGIFSSLFFLVNKRESKGIVLLKMFGYLVLQGSRIKGSTASKTIFAFWIFFAYLINCYYQSNLVSSLTTPHLEYQIASSEDIKNHNLQPCVSKSIDQVAHEILNQSFIISDEKECEKDLIAITTVRNARDRFTISLLSLYEYYATDFYDDRGKPAIYTIDPPITNILYASYLYKGFPMYEKLQDLYLRIGQAGLVLRHFEILKSERIEKQSLILETNNERIKVFIPWSVLVFGTCLASIVFIIEIMVNNLHHKYITRI